MRLNVLVTAVVVGLAGIAWGPKDSAALPRNDAATLIEAKQHKLDNRVKFLHVMVDDSTSGFIIPCVKIRTWLWNAAQSDPSLTIRIQINYSSNGVPTTKTLVMPVRNLMISDHHQQHGQAWLIMETEMDVSAAPMDLDQPYTGSVSVGTVGGVPTRLASF